MQAQPSVDRMAMAIYDNFVGTVERFAAVGRACRVILPPTNCDEGRGEKKGDLLFQLAPIQLGGRVKSTHALL